MTWKRHLCPLVLLGLVVATGASGCSDANRVTGVYRSQELVDIEGYPEPGVFVELVLGQFGPDVTGLVRFFRDEYFLIAAPGGCDCRFLQEGRFDEERVLFTFKGPIPCDPTAPLMGARLEADASGDTLQGRLGARLDGDPVWTFVRVVTEENLTDNHKRCEEGLVQEAR